MPAMERASRSRRAVRMDTSSSSATSAAVTRPRDWRNRRVATRRSARMPRIIAVEAGQQVATSTADDVGMTTSATHATSSRPRASPRRSARARRGVAGARRARPRRPAGQVTAVLGPNGAGKSTLVRAVATLLRPDAGRLRRGRHRRRPAPRAGAPVIGLAGQYAAVEPAMTGRENLVMVARLFGHGRRAARAAADTVLGQLGLEDAADRLVRGYSGGMRRRLDLGASLVGGAPPAAARRADHRPRPPQPHRAVGGHPGARARPAPTCC